MTRTHRTLVQEARRFRLGGRDPASVRGRTPFRVEDRTGGGRGGSFQKGDGGRVGEESETGPTAVQSSGVSGTAHVTSGVCHLKPPRSTRPLTVVEGCPLTSCRPVVGRGWWGSSERRLDKPCHGRNSSSVE